MAAQLVHPVTVTLLLLAIGLGLQLARWRKTGFCVAVLAFAWTYALATPAVSQRLRAPLEQAFPPTPVTGLPDADAIVVLGGGVYPQVAPRLGHNLGHAADRVWWGATLFAAGKAPLVITTGRRPYANEGPSAAEAQASILETLGVPAEAIVARGRSENTRTDAEVVKGVLSARGLDRVLLVTSALHMRRALSTFQQLGIPAFPAPTDFEVTDVPFRNEIPWLPSGDAFWASGRAMHEYVGSAWYRFKGWM